MKPNSRYQGSLLAQITSVPKTTKRHRYEKGKDDFIVEDTNVTLRENYRSKAGNSLSSIESGKTQEGQVKSDSLKRSSKFISSSSEHSQDVFNTNSFNSADRDKSQSVLSLKDKKTEQMSRASSKRLLGPQFTQKGSNDDSYVSYGGNRLNIPQSGFAAIPKVSRFPKQRSSSNAQTNDLALKNKIVSRFNQEEQTQKDNQKTEPSTDQISTDATIQNEDLVKKISEPLRRRLVVNLPINDFEARRVQVTSALDMAEQDVDEISENVNQINDDLIELSQNSRGISEKSMYLTQTAEAVLSKVKVMDDWIDGLGKVGSGLKIQLIEWIVKFVSFLSSLLLLLYQTIRKANPFALLKKKEKGKKKK